MPKASSPVFICLVAVALLAVGGCAVSDTPQGTAIEDGGEIEEATATPELTTATVQLPTPTLTPAATAGPPAGEPLKLEDYNGGSFTIRKPAGWEVTTAGYCSTFALQIIDTASPVNRIFYFNEIGPVYLAEEQKSVDSNYMAMGGYPIDWFEMPVIDPLTPENFLQRFYLVANTDFIRYFVSELPELNDVEIISSEAEPSFLAGGQTKVIRCLFKARGELGEGLFYLTVAPVVPLTGLPGGGIGYGFCFVGISSAKADFRYWQETLTQSIESLNISQSYISNCLQQQQQYESALKAGKTLSDASDIIMDVWENRNRSDDILSEKWSDAILGNERVYDPGTGEVYQVPNGFYDGYDLHREEYEMNGLQPLPDDGWQLWTAPTLSGDRIH